MVRFIDAYRAKANDGLIEFDAAQAQAAEILSILEARIANFKPFKPKFLFGRPEPTPKGLFIYGKVGRGKSMLMDLFFEHTKIEPKRRVHFHEFMAMVHDEINKWRKLSNDERKQLPNFVKGAGDDPIAPIAKKIANETWLLCFDEFQITDIADAMILGRLFDALWSYQCVIVATSNRHPKDQYQNGLNRQIILPFLARLEEELDIHSLDSDRDYRLERLEQEATYFHPLNQDAKDFISRAWERLTFGANPLAQKIIVEGRQTEIKRTAAGVALFDFTELCGDYSSNQSPLGVRDYLEISRIFNTIIIENVPQLGKDKANEATRFRNLIDALYEHKTKLIISAAVEASDLYKEGTQSFEFERTASRLYEMRSHDYLSLPHDTI
ncbi:MAG: AFG1 family ATPase [Caulobacterales bacterium]|nr:AFG1 family ATPase [Caulobacterales bacterium]